MISHQRQQKKYFQIQQNFNFDYTFGNGMRNRTVAGFDYLKTKDRSRYIYLASGNFDSSNGADYSGFNGSVLGTLYSDPNKVGHFDSDGDLNTYSGYVSNVFTPTSGLNIVLGIR
jgi:iron complex outermembrane receptor protein